MHGWTENYVRVTAKFDPMLITETKPVTLSSINDKILVEVDEVEEYVTH